MKNISPKGLSLIKKFEGCRLKAYKPVKTEKYYTIGYGHYSADVKADSVITPLQAEQILLMDIARFARNVNSYDHIYHWTQNEFDALVSFAFNIGSINQLTNNGKRTKAEIADKIPAYNKAGKKVLDGLTRRRLEERALFLSK